MRTHSESLAGGSSNDDQCAVRVGTAELALSTLPAVKSGANGRVSQLGSARAAEPTLAGRLGTVFQQGGHTEE